MADFCAQCTLENFGSGLRNDFDGICVDGASRKVLCEGCGNIYVNHRGECTGCEEHPAPVRGVRDDSLPGHADNTGMRGEGRSQ